MQYFNRWHKLPKDGRTALCYHQLGKERRKTLQSYDEAVCKIEIWEQNILKLENLGLLFNSVGPI